MKTLILIEYTVIAYAILTILFLIIRNLKSPNEKFKEIYKYISGGTFIAFIFLAIFLGGKLVSDTEAKPCKNIAVPKVYENIDKTRVLIDAIAEVESGNDSTAKNSKSTASGHLQILKGLVDEANKNDEGIKFEYADRFSKDKAEEIFRIIQERLNKKGDIEKAIRLWKGGPGYTTASTQEYYEAVRSVYNRMMDEKMTAVIRNVKSVNL